MGFFIRWVFAFLLLVLTYNPTFWSYGTWAYLAWANGTYGGQLPFFVLGAVVLVIAYIIYLRATLNSIGVFGMILILALVGAVVWVLFSQGWLTFGNYAFNTWVIIFALSLVLAIGMYWSTIWRRMSGQQDVDEVDTP